MPCPVVTLPTHPTDRLNKVPAYLFSPLLVLCSSFIMFQSAKSAVVYNIFKKIAHPLIFGRHLLSPLPSPINKRCIWRCTYTSRQHRCCPGFEELSFPWGKKAEGLARGAATYQVCGFELTMIHLSALVPSPVRRRS